MTVVLLIIIAILALFIFFLLLNNWRDRPDGAIVVIETEDKKTFRVEPYYDPDEFDKHKKLIFDVKQESE